MKRQHEQEKSPTESLINPNKRSRIEPDPAEASAQEQLLQAIKVNNPALAQSAIDRCADVNATDEYGRTPLHDAASSGFVDIVRALITKKANVNVIDHNDSTPLHDAAFKGDTSTVQVLITAGANANKRDKWGNTPLHLAAISNKDTVQILIAAKVNVNATGNQDNTPLHGAALMGRTDIVQILIEASANANVTEKLHGKTPLHFAAIGGHTNVVQTLITANANVYTIDNSGHTPLHDAAIGGHTNIVEMFINAIIQQGLNLVAFNALNHQGQTAANLAAINGHTQIEIMLNTAAAQMLHQSTYLPHAQYPSSFEVLRRQRQAAIGASNTPLATSLTTTGNRVLEMAMIPTLRANALAHLTNPAATSQQRLSAQIATLPEHLGQELENAKNLTTRTANRYPYN